MEEEEEEVSWSWPEWFPNGRFPESTVIKLMSYFVEKEFEVFSEEFSDFIIRLELLTSVYAQKKNFDKINQKPSGIQIKEILKAMKELTLKLKDAHNDTLLRIRIDSDTLERKIYGKSINHYQMHKFDGLERDLSHVICAIEQGKYSQRAINQTSNRATKIEKHEFVNGVTETLRAYLKMEPIKAQIQKTIGIILMEEGNRWGAIDNPKNPQDLF